MSKLIDLTGKRYSNLVVIERAESKHGSTYWKCICDCGNTTEVRASNLKNGLVKSCGCLLHKTHNTHHLSNTRLYVIWNHMKRRCYEKSNPAYKYYGARGVTVCNEWLDFESFYNWAISNGYRDDLTIDRINNDGDYKPDNCRWVNMKTQSNNRRSCHMITYNGETKNLTQWCNELNLNYKLVHDRIVSKGWSFERAITTPVDVKKRNNKYK